MLIGITIVAVVVALLASGVAWRTVREERRRSDARVAALAREIHGTSDNFDLELQASRSSGVALKTASQPMFATVGPARTGSRLGLVLAIGSFVAATIGAVAIVFSSGAATAPRVADHSTSAPSPSAAVAGRDPDVRPSMPLELVTLAHERDGDTLTVRGTIRNPASGSEMSRLTAIVFLFDRNGGFLASGRAAVDSPALIPGGESTFAVSVPATGDVARYRVSFRSGDRIVSHIDKRNRS
jgi:hypothetical protein